MLSGLCERGSAHLGWRRFVRVREHVRVRPVGDYLIFRFTRPVMGLYLAVCAAATVSVDNEWR